MARRIKTERKLIQSISIFYIIHKKNQSKTIRLNMDEDKFMLDKERERVRERKLSSVKLKSEKCKRFFSNYFEPCETILQRFAIVFA